MLPDGCEQRALRQDLARECQRLAPRAARTESSRSRVVARARKSWLTFAQAIKSTPPHDASKIKSE